MSDITHAPAKPPTTRRSLTWKDACIILRDMKRPATLSAAKDMQTETAAMMLGRLSPVGSLGSVWDILESVFGAETYTQSVGWAHKREDGDSVAWNLLLVFALIAKNGNEVLSRRAGS